MRKLVAFIAVVSMTTLSAAVHGESAKEVIEKAIEAHGGKENLKKYRAAKVISKGKMNLLGGEVAFDGETMYQLPNQSKNLMTLELQGQKISIVQVCDGDKVKVTSNDTEAPLSEEQKTEIKEAIHVQELQSLIGLLEAMKYDLSVLEKAEKVGEQEVVGILIKSKGFRDTALYFDKKSSLLVKMTRKGLNPEQKLVDQVALFSEYKRFDGIMRPVKSELFMGDNKFLTSETTEYKHLEKLDKKNFDLSN